MKIGIMTFHWATNYGAILQAYCLQEYLKELGHEVEIINYKPKQYDYSWLRLLRHPSLWRTITKELNNKEKESLLVSFRNKYLRQTHRYYTCTELSSIAGEYDAFVTGSDQVLNPSFALWGENGRPSSAYFLGFIGDACKKIGYAVSFGCTSYSSTAKDIVCKWIKEFDAVSTRESSGLTILDDFGFQGYKQIVPDPTILYGKKFFYNLGIDHLKDKEDYTCVYMLRKNIQVQGNVRYIDEQHEPLSMDQWLTTISHAKRLLTNSYHGMIMAILSHVPFVALMETGSSAGMNDRFMTLLSAIGLQDRIAYTLDEADRIFEKEIDFQAVDKALDDYRQLGVDYIKRVL